MEELEKQIIKAKHALNKMLAQHLELRSQMNHIHNPIIHRTPPEISSFIFQFCLPETLPEDSSRESTKIENCAPLVLGSVCRTWRQIAWSSPSLWASITILLNDPSKYSTQYEVAHEWLMRSGRLPLTIRFQSPDSDAVEILHLLVDLIRHYSSRWQHLYLDIPSYMMPLFGHSGELPMLRSLMFKGTTPDESHWRLSSKLRMANSNLKTVSILGFPVKDVIIDWTCVTHLNLEFHHDEGFLKVLLEASRLTYCKLSIKHPNFSNLDKPIIHHYLRAFDVATWDGWATDSDDLVFFDNLTLPALDDFTCQMSGIYKPPGFRSLVSFFERSSCPLKNFKLSLAIVSARIGFVDIPSLLRATPFLRNFQLCVSDRTGCTYENILIPLDCSRLTSSHADGPLLPALESMTLTSLRGRFPWILVPPIFGFPCEAHSTHQRPLQKLDIFIHQGELDEPSKEYIDQKAILRYLQLTEAGINVNIVTIPSGHDWLEASMEHHGIEF